MSDYLLQSRFQIENNIKQKILSLIFPNYIKEKINQGFFIIKIVI